MHPKQLFWLECDEADLPAGEAWISEAETACFRPRWVPKRRQDWLLGRWTAKRALVEYAGIPANAEGFRRLSILSAITGAPVAWIEGAPMGVSLSISHRGGRALVVLGPRTMSVGCDLEKVEIHSRSFLESFFTQSEVQQVEEARSSEQPNLESLIWSAKESVLKLLSVGLSVDTRCVSISPDIEFHSTTAWQQFSALVVDGRRFSGWWQGDSAWLRTITSSEETLAPQEFGFASRQITRDSF